MPQVFLLKKAQLPNASCASYVISDADLPQNLSEIEIKLSGQDEKKLSQRSLSSPHRRYRYQDPLRNHL